MFDDLRRDAKRYVEYGGWWRSLGFWVGACYRASVAAHRLRIPMLRLLCIALAWLLKQPFHLVLHVELPSRARIGPGFLMIHPFNILIGSSVEIGDECSIYHEVTLGPGRAPNVLRLGNHVVIFPGARVFGGITVGDNAEIGANCVVMRDVPPSMLVVPPISRTIPKTLTRASSKPPDKDED